MSISFRRPTSTDTSFVAMWQDRVSSRFPDLSAQSLDALIRLNTKTPGFFVEGSNETGAILMLAYVNVMRVVGFLGLGYTVVWLGAPQMQGRAIWIDRSVSSYLKVLPALVAFLRREAPHSIFMIGELEHENDLDLLEFCQKSLGYSVVFSGERSHVDVGVFSDYDEYLDILDKKDRWFAKKVMKTAIEQSVELIVTDDYESHLDRMYELYCSVHKRASEVVSPPEEKEFFEHVCREKTPGRTALLVLRHGALAGFCLLSESNGLLSCGFCGIDHAIVKEINTWYLLMLTAIHRSIEGHKERIILGTTNFSMKKKLGARKSDLYAVVGFPNPFMRRLFQSVLRNAFYKIYAIRDRNGLESAN